MLLAMVEVVWYLLLHKKMNYFVFIVVRHYYLYCFVIILKNPQFYCNMISSDLNHGVGYKRSP